MANSPVMQSAGEILRQYWGYDRFRPGQGQIIQSVLEGNDTLAILPTSGGKSICFQVPGLLLDGVCLVITPLIALMKDQVFNLESRGIPAIALDSGMTYFELKKALEDTVSGRYKFLYLSPERLEAALFRNYLPALNINLIAVDEAHCISQWGYDFRPPYLRVGALRVELPGIPVLALSASATPLVQKDILKKLNFVSPGIYRGSFERPNLQYQAIPAANKLQKLLEILETGEGSSIVYCRSRKLTGEIAAQLAAAHISADFYHAGLSRDERTWKQEQWINNTIRVMVCTNAFGMGIDKPDVRSVIHYNPPDCLENYYQEAGRCGRDGEKASAVLLFQQQDLDILKSMPEKRFPPVTEIQRVYQSLADFLEIPVGIGEGNYYDFDIGLFVKNFKLDSALVISVLKVLEQEGHLSFFESIFLPAQVCFKTDKDQVLDFAETHPEFEDLLKTLLRSYEGVLENLVSIHEKQLSAWLAIREAQLKNDLRKLQSFGILEYLPKKETPQIHFLLNRAPAKFLQIDLVNYEQRKNLYKLRIETMLHYASGLTTCRSRFIAGYFGDPEAADCGNCDNCIRGRS